MSTDRESLPPAFRQPEGFSWGSFISAKGVPIRYGTLPAQGAAKGTIVIVTGFREMIEKYFEVASEMAALGFSVWMPDWRGQGGSGRYFLANPQKVHGEGYDEHLAMLHQFSTKIVKKSEGPFVLLAHSMGSHLGLRFLKEHAGVFSGAALVSPMCDIHTPGLPRPVALALVWLAKVFGCLEWYIPLGRDWNAEDEVFLGNNKTSDPERFAVQGKIFKMKPELKMGNPTFGWVLHTLCSIKILKDAEYLRSITTPVLMGISGDDTIVSTEAGKRACSLLPHCTPVYIADAKHEIWMERDELRAPWLEAVVKFLNQYSTVIPAEAGIS